MPLLLSTLEQELTNLMDSTSPNFVGMPNSMADVASNWSNVMFNYTASIIPPSTTGSAAKSAMESILLGIAAPGSFFPLFTAGITAFATTLAAGMLPTYTGVIPVAPLVIEPAMMAIPLVAGNDALRISTMAGIIDTWFRTGTAVLVAPPYTVIPWS